MEENTAILRARAFLARHSVVAAPVDVIALAAAEGFDVVKKDLAEGESGSSGERRGRRYIWVNEREPPSRQRFTVLHEIAHHVLGMPSVHGQASGSQDEAQALRPRRPIEEIACDAFASECLVPYALLKPLIEDHAFSAAAVQALSDRFEASQQCIALQWMKASDDTLAFVLARERRIVFAFASKRAKEAGLRIASGRMLPAASAADGLVRNSSDEVATADLDASDWSDADAAARFVAYEEATNYVPLQLTYSFLTFEAATPDTPSDSARASSEDEEPLLEELTGTLTWKR